MIIIPYSFCISIYLTTNLKPQIVGEIKTLFNLSDPPIFLTLPYGCFCLSLYLSGYQNISILFANQNPVNKQKGIWSKIWLFTFNINMDDNIHTGNAWKLEIKQGW